MRFLKLFIFVLFLLIQLSGITAQEIDRIVSLAPSLTKNLYLLNVQDELVGCTSYCPQAIIDNKTVIGSAIEVNIEKVLLQKPDLILATVITNPETIETFRKLNIQVEVFPSPKDFEEMCDQLIYMGSILGIPDVAEQVVSSESKKVEEISKMVPENAHYKMFFQIGSNPIFTVLTNTFMNDFILLSGGENICKEMKRGTISRELVVLRNPDVILVSDMGEIGYEEKKIWESFPEMSAVKRKNVIIVDSDKSCSPTVTDFTETLQFIIESINYE